MKILITGFKPFNKETINPALEIIKSIDKKYLNNEIETLELDVVYNKDAISIIKKVNDFQPDIVLSIGQAGGRKKVMIEYFALNMQSATIPDNDNVTLKHNPLDESLLLCYKTNVDVVKLEKFINNDNFGISYHAGTFVCNDIYYQTLNYIYKNNLNIKCAFIHVPYIKEQVHNKEGIPFMEFEDIQKIIYKIIEGVVND